MIRPLRRWHRFAWTLLLVVLPLVFWAGLAVRKQVPAMEQAPDVLRTGPPPNAEALRTLDFSTSAFPSTARLLKAGERLYLELTAQQAATKPDLLVYWHGPNDEDGWLLGRLAGRETRWFPLPNAAGQGKLRFYSLAHGESLDEIALALPAVAEETP